MDVLEYTDISKMKKIGEGTSRAIYESDIYPGSVLKIRKSDWKHPAAENQFFKRLLLKVFPDLRNRIFSREIAQIKSCDRKKSATSGAPPLPRYFGSTHTDLGTAHVFEKIQSGDGTVVQLRELVQANGISPYLAMLSDLATQLFDWNIVVYDLQRDNIVLDQNKSDERFVLIDGFGNNNAIPLRSFFKSLNFYYLNKTLSEFARVHGITWDARNRVFI